MENNLIIFSISVVIKSTNFFSHKTCIALTSKLLVKSTNIQHNLLTKSIGSHVSFSLAAGQQETLFIITFTLHWPSAPQQQQRTRTKTFRKRSKYSQTTLTALNYTLFTINHHHHHKVRVYWFGVSLTVMKMINFSWFQEN